LLVLVLAGLAAVLSAAVLLSPPRVRLVQFDRIKTGMTRSEVEAILGPPVASEALRWRTGPGGANIWKGAGGDVRVVFSANGEVVSCGWYTGGDLTEGMFGAFVRWARLQWRRWFP
jgi:hypothetical protein